MAATRRRIWRKIGCGLGLIVLLALIAAGIWLYQYAANLVQQNVHPPRFTSPLTPPDYGIKLYQEVSFVTSDGLTIRGWFIPGSNGATVILGHTLKGSRVVMLPDAATLSQRGYNVLMFDWRGEGLSDGDTISFGQFEVRDMKAAVDYLIDQKKVDPQRIGAEGESLGGSVVILAAAQDPRIKAVISISSFTSLQDVADFQTRGLPFVGALAMQIGQQQAGVDASQARPIDVVCRISPRPLLLIYGANEDFLPPDSAAKMSAAACDPKQLWVVPGAGHGGFRDVVPQEFAARIVAFFDHNLLK